MIDLIELTESQKRALEIPVQGGLFIEGPAGTGKSTLALVHLERIVKDNPHDSILVWVPQRTLASRYFDLIHSLQIQYSGEISLLTLGGLSRRMVDLFWPLVAADAGFGQPDEPPTFLTLERA